MKKVMLCFSFFFIVLYVDALSMMWWNVMNFFDTVDDQSKEDSILTEAEYFKKLSCVSEIIINYSPDIIGLCEIENIDIVRDLSDKSGYKYSYLIEGNDPRGIDIALISRFPVDYITHKDQYTPYRYNKYYKFSRDCPEAVFDYNGERFHILLNHFKATFKDSERERMKQIAQANGVLSIINDIYMGKGKNNLIVVGDLNSVRYSEVINIFEKSGLTVLNYFKNQNSFYTYSYKGRKQDIDYIIVNDKLLNGYKIKSLKTINIENIKTISDHFPIFLEISKKR